MSQAIIYQIGRLDTNVFKKIKFFIEKNTFETTLSSFAIRDFLKEKKSYNSKIILIYPVSLPFNPSLINNELFKSSCPEKCYELLKQVINNPQEYLKDPSIFFKEHPHTKIANSFKIIHSLGEYKTLHKTFKFESHYSDIVIMILIDMIKNYLQHSDEIEKIIIDISSGHNIYVSALIESFRYLGTWIKLYNWDDQNPQLEIAFSDPITQINDNLYKLHFEKQSIKAFFSPPITKNDINNYKLSKAIFPENNQREHKNSIQSMLEGFAKTFSAIKNNTPLTIYEFGYHYVDNLKETLNTFIDHIEKKLNESYEKTPNLNKEDNLKVLLTCGFYIGLSKVLNTNGITKSETIEIKDIRKKFNTIYKIFNLDLNDIILGNEVDKIIKGINKNTDWILLLDVFYKGNKKETKPQKRNFFAHAGFEGSITELKKQEQNIYLRYINNRNKDTIEKWLKESI